MSDQPAPSLWSRIKGLVFFGWAVSAMRIVLDSVAGTTGAEWAATAAWCVGIYWFMPPMFVWHGISRGPMCDLTWPKMALAVLLIGVLVLGLPNIGVYSAAQFQGWSHGRFNPGREVVVEPKAGDPPGEVKTRIEGKRFSPPAETAGGKVWEAMKAGLGTTLFGSGWLILWATGTIWFPAQARRRRRSS